MQPENETNMPLEVMSEYSSMGILAFSTHTVQLNNMHKRNHISLKKMLYKVTHALCVFHQVL